MDTGELNPDDFIDDDDDYDEQGTEVHVTDAFERAYRDDRSWETLAEDEHGRLIAAREVGGQRKRYRQVQDVSRVRRGLIRYVQLVIDMSSACVGATDYRPNRVAALVALSKEFVSEFFDQNPLSQLSLSAMRNGGCYRLSELSAAADNHRKVLEKGMETGGAVSLQNALEQTAQVASTAPPYGHRECLILLSSLTTCDPGDIMAAIEVAKKATMRVTILSLSAEMFVSRKIADDTKGSYHVALSQTHLHELLMAQCSPPPTTAASVVAKLVRMAFPTKDSEGAANAVFTGAAGQLVGGAYTCPKCLSKSSDIPTQCHVCSDTLISSPHLARSYHHLFPLEPFEEVQLGAADRDAGCAACCMPFSTALDDLASLEDPDVGYQCPKCKLMCCSACDIFMHDHLHNCPGCEEKTAVR